MPKKSPAKLKQFMQSWFEEKNSAYLYHFIAKKETKKNRDLFLQLAEEAEKQAILWERKISEEGVAVPKYHPNMRARITVMLINLFGPKNIRTILAATKVRGLSVYLQSPPGHPWPKTIADVGRQHKKMGNGNNLRAAVFGINDGLISNLSLILGMVGAHSSNKIIILAGIAGLLAGAFSMGAGEYISVTSQREMFEHQIALEKSELELYPEEEKEELALIYQARGLSKAEAHEVATTLMQDPKSALQTLAREELGINPDDLVSPVGAAISSFISFTIGAAIPLAPFLFKMANYQLQIAIGLTACCLLIVGAILSLYTGRSALLSALRMLLIGAIAGSVTYFIGTLVEMGLR